MAPNYSHKEHFGGLFGTPAVQSQSLETSQKEGQASSNVSQTKLKETRVRMREA